MLGPLSDLIWILWYWFCVILGDSTFDVASPPKKRKERKDKEKR